MCNKTKLVSQIERVIREHETDIAHVQPIYRKIDADQCFFGLNNDDFHLKSQAGRWDSNSQLWFQDNVTCPFIDAADSMSPIGWESFQNDGFINMGACSGTPEERNIYIAQPICETVVAGNINGDCQIKWSDGGIMALCWTDEEPLSP